MFRTISKPVFLEKKKEHRPEADTHIDSADVPGYIPVLAAMFSEMCCAVMEVPHDVVTQVLCC
jgi:hypothetical protein